MAKLPFVGHKERATELLALVHIDMCGLFDMQVRDDYTYFITFTDDLSSYEYVYLIKHNLRPLKSSRNSGMK